MKFLLVLACLLGLALGGWERELQCDYNITSLCPFPDSGSPVYFADPDDCSAYCECSAGIAWKFFCGPETLYDENLHLCNWEDMVDCGERPII
ncbi:uncharacterized protein [Penaeus vannamei]|uniref:uncharacterized protein n=1 Tax=Penaeus vannamei TaxID=6689 RepID=UPI000F6744F8|nr:uncharacterized protein LOC113800117 isoform X2 [Penaeus vannamei]